VDTTGSITAATEEYDGSSWSGGVSLNTARYGGAGAGTQTAALAFGGEQEEQLQEQQKNMMVLLGQQVELV
jgi:hypothetical protein